MIFQYNPYAQVQQPQMATGNPYGSQNAFANNQAQGPKKLTIPTWLAWLIAIGFIAGLVALWFLL